MKTKKRKTFVSRFIFLWAKLARYPTRRPRSNCSQYDGFPNTSNYFLVKHAWNDIQLVQFLLRDNGGNRCGSSYILRPNLVLLDIYIPGSNGLDMLSYIRQYFPDTDVIMITAAKEVEAIREAVRSGAFDYIMKPLIFNRLQETLLRYLDFHRELNRLNHSGSINQSDVDRLISGTSKKDSRNEISYLPKGIDKLTLVKIVQAITAAANGMSADQIAKEIGVSRSTGRRYLEHLVTSGEVFADLTYGVVGRPERVYRKRES